MATAEVRTLRQFLESDQVIDCDCSNYWICSHTGPLRIELAILRLGSEFDFYAGRHELAAHTYCSVCGKFHPTFRLGWKTRPATYTGLHGGGATPISVLTAPALLSAWVEPDDWLVGGKGVRKFGPRR
ncbi:hypothetical protein PRN20_09580 [Devosia sp. ZB163]|uniref:hypothetical protein n=1 Tax=Devosia sp. ZB163 TaxID=3025938 RepID=UPI002361A6C1|nr:hypothetical protein [Devosia sp. ZB163]MDC9823986.1 hypothetical protein [Devosia sp. ZB163]